MGRSLPGIDRMLEIMPTSMSVMLSIVKFFSKSRNETIQNE